MQVSLNGLHGVDTVGEDEDDASAGSIGSFSWRAPLLLGDQQSSTTSDEGPVAKSTKTVAVLVPYESESVAARDNYHGIVHRGPDSMVVDQPNASPMNTYFGTPYLKVTHVLQLE